MAIPKLKRQDILNALKFIDENGVPEQNTSVKYVLVSENGKKYPPKYVVAVADHLANSTDISTESFNSVDAKNYLESLGFSIETKQQEKFDWGAYRALGSSLGRYSSNSSFLACWSNRTRNPMSSS